MATQIRVDTSIKKEINNRYNEINWSDELAPDGLPKPEQKTITFPLPASLVPLAQKTPPVFPVLKGFGSLNNSDMPSDLKKMLDSFFVLVQSVQKTTREKNDDAKLAAEKTEKTGVPAADSKLTEKPSDPSPIKPVQQSFKEYINPVRIFLPTILQYSFQNLPPVERVIYGKSFPLEDCVEIPVRLYNNDTYTDCFVYAVQSEDGSYKIDQIQFGETIGNTVFPN